MSKGANVYDHVRSAFGTLTKSRELQKWAASMEPCIFLSHKGEDKAAVHEIGEYVKKRGINIYLDANDPALQQAVHTRDDEKITQFIERGIRCSSDLMVFISGETRTSWWVPYEIGFGKNAGKALSCLKLKDVEHLPSYLSIIEHLRNTQELDDYLRKVRQRTTFAQITRATRGRPDYEINPVRQLMELLLEEESGSKPHPWSRYLDEG